MSLVLLARRWIPRLLTPRVDVPLFLALLMLAGVGLMTLHSAAVGDAGLLQAQAMRFGFGFVVLWVISRIPPQQLRLWAPWLFALSVVLLLLVPFLGTGRSARSWLNLGFFYLQPAELLKLAVPLLVASWLHSQVLPPRLGALLVSAVIIGLPTALIAIQPDLGTALVVAASGAFVVFFAGIQWRWIFGLGSAALLAAPLAWPFLREYHRNRFMTFLNPEADPLGVGWNIIQSKIAVGSGGLFGKGWGLGTQSRLDFLPEHTTDFIFSVFAEEFGWVGSVGTSSSRRLRSAREGCSAKAGGWVRNPVSTSCPNTPPTSSFRYLRKSLAGSVCWRCWVFTCSSLAAACGSSLKRETPSRASSVARWR